MKKVTFSLLFLFLTTNLNAQTVISGGDVSGTWTKENSPYIVTDDIRVARNDSLTIEAGVEVRFDNYKKFEIRGILNAVGAEGDSVVFKRNGDQRWEWLEFTSGGRGRLSFVVITGGDSGLRCYSEIQVTVRDSRIANNSQLGFYFLPRLPSDELVIIRSVIENSNRNYVSGPGKVIIANSLIQNNNHWSAIFECVYGGSIVFSNTVICKNNTGSVATTSNGGQIHFANSLIYDNTTSYTAITADGSIQNSIFRGTNLIDSSKNMSVEYSNIEGGADGVGNIDADPLFVDAGNGNFALQPGSPCVDAGNPSVFYNDDDGSRNDMGVFGGSDVLPVPVDLHFDFGPAAGGETVDFKLHNFRDTPFVLTGVTFSDPQNFSSDFNSAVTIASNASVTTKIEYLGVTTGEFEETVRFSSPDFFGGDNPRVILTGFSGTFGNVSGTWTKANSPYLATGDILVPAGQTLAIEPGVEVRFAGSFEFKVEGQLDAVGVEGDTIVFTRDKVDTIWKSIRFNEANRSTLEFVKIDYADPGGLYTYQSDLRIQNCLFTNNEGFGCAFSRSTILIVDTDIIANENKNHRDSGGFSCLYSDLTIVNSRIGHNSSAADNGAFYAYDSKIAIYGTEVFANTGGSVSDISLSRITINNCTFYGNVGRAGSEDVRVNSRSVADISNSIIPAISVINNGKATVSYSNVEGGHAGEGNIDADPLFVDPDNGNFALQPGSPSIDSGNPSAFYNDWDGSRNDMGATGGSDLIVSPTVVDFGPTGQGQTKSVRVYISNFRNSGVELTTAALTDEINFGLAAATPMTIAEMSTDSVTVTINPRVIGLLNEELVFTSPDFAGADSASVALRALAGIWQGPVSGNWTSANSPVILGGDVIVEFGTSLTIDPGVEVLVDTSFGASTTQFLVKGSLIAEGTESSPIIFGAIAGQEIPGVWRGIRLMLRENEYEYNQPASPSLASASDENEAEDREPGRTEITDKEFRIGKDTGAAQTSMNLLPASKARLSHCRIEYATIGITAESDSITIQDCYVANNSEHGVKWFRYEGSASGKMVGNTIEKNGEWGIYCHAICEERYGFASPDVIKNTVTKNGSGGIYLYAEGGSPNSWRGRTDHAYVSPIIEKNIIAENNGEAIKGYANPDWTQGYISTHRSFAHVDPTITLNAIYGNSEIIATRSPGLDKNDRRIGFSTFTIDRSTFWNAGDLLLAATDSAKIILHNSILWGDGSLAQTTNNGGAIAASFSIIKGGLLGEGNIDVDPLFVDPFSSDFGLQENSPAIDAGDPASPLDADGTRADMGAIPFLQKAAAPVLVSPADKTSGLPTILTFEWDVSISATSYQIQISTDSTFSSTEIDTSNITSTTLQISGLVSDTTYYWRVRAGNPGGLSEWSDTFRFTTALATSVDMASETIPIEFALSQNYPNPFNPETTIRFSLPVTAQVRLSIYDLTGRQIAVLVDQEKNAGYHSIKWNGRDRSGNKVASGVYLYRLETKAFTSVRKLTLLK